jgi:protein involved in polysaccharide export with SLBB domain
MNRLRWAIRVAVLGILISAAPVQAQLPTSRAEALRLLQEDPDLARQRLLESGMSEAEIRAQLAAAGIPADALDAFLAGESIDGTALDTDALAALQTLGVVVQGVDGLEVVETVSGMQFGEVADSSDGGFPIFGHDVFTRATSLFQPLLSGPVSDDYQLGPGDQLLLLLTGEVELAEQLDVTREGFVVVPQVGRISIANLTMAEVRAVFRERLAGFYSGIRRGTTTVNVTITELRTIQIAVAGEINQPGAYQLSSVATVTNALYAANGPTELGNLRDIRISRRDGDDATLDLYPYLLNGDASGDITLEQGDVIFVPLKERRVQLHGSVVRPARYELSDAEDLIDVLIAGGGFAPEANRSRITIHRVVRPGERGPGLGDRLAIDFGLTPSDDETATNHLGGVVIPPIGLQDGDSIVVDQVPSLAGGYYVIVTGMVAQPDTFPWREGMTIRDIVELARGPIVGADLRAAEVSRLPDDRGSGELADRLRVPLDSSYLSQRASDGRYVGPPGVDFPPPGASAEFALDPYDQVLIMRQPEFEMPQSVKITGEVAVPGEYTLLTKNDRVTDLVDRAGALLENGYLEGAQLYRSQAGMGRIDLNLPAAISDPESQENVLLQPGDSLHIPTYTPTVVVNGAVNSPVTVLYREGQDFDYYIRAAGGFRGDADKGRTAVRFANGLAQTRSKFLFWSSYPEPDAGSTITVPAKDPNDRIDKVALTTSIVSVLGSITTMIVVIVANSN